MVLVPISNGPVRRLVRRPVRGRAVITSVLRRLGDIGTMQAEYAGQADERVSDDVKISLNAGHMADQQPPEKAARVWATHQDRPARIGSGAGRHVRAGHLPVSSPQSLRPVTFDALLVSRVPRADHLT